MKITKKLTIKAAYEVWSKLLESCPENTIYLTPEWQETWWSSFGQDREMSGFYIEGPNGPIGIASLSKQQGTFSLLGNPETFDYNDFIILPGYEKEFFTTLLDYLESEGSSRLELYSLRESSPPRFYLPQLARDRGYTVDISEEDVVPGLELPQEWESYVGSLSRKDRHELRRKFRRLESLSSWRWYIVEDENSVLSHIDEFLRLMRLSALEKSEYMNAEREIFFRKMTKTTASLGLMKLFFLEIDGVNVASSLCFDYGRSRLLYNSGYDPESSYYSVGLLMNALCIKDAINLELQYFDFLRGAEPYKYHLGGVNHDIFSMVVKGS